MPANAFDSYRIAYNALPNVNYESIDLSTNFCGYDVAAPLYIPAVAVQNDGEREQINKHLATACHRERIPYTMCKIKDGDMHVTILKDLAPDVPLFVNIDANRLGNGLEPEDVQLIVDGVGADGLIFTINHLKETFEPVGVSFNAILDRLTSIVRDVGLPVIINNPTKYGMDEASAQKFKDIGAEVVDVVGSTTEDSGLGFIYEDISLPVDESIKASAKVGGLKVAASGGIRNGLDMAKAISLGADHVALDQGHLYDAAKESPEAVQKVIQRVIKEMKVAFFAAGANNVIDMQNKSVVRK